MIHSAFITNQRALIPAALLSFACLSLISSSAILILIVLWFLAFWIALCTWTLRKEVKEE